MRNLLIRLAIALLRRALDAPLWTRLRELVREADAFDEPGSDKRDLVLDSLQNLYAETIRALPGWLVGLALEAAVAELRLQR